MMLGSTANYVLHHAQCPVVIVHGRQTAPPRRVVVGGDAPSHEAVGRGEAVEEVDGDVGRGLLQGLGGVESGGAGPDDRDAKGVEGDGHAAVTGVR